MPILSAHYKFQGLAFDRSLAYMILSGIKNCHAGETKGPQFIGEKNIAPQSLHFSLSLHSWEVNSINLIKLLSVLFQSAF